MGCCKDGGCGSQYVAPPSVNEEVETMRGTIQLMKVSELFSDSEIKLMEKAIESHWMYEELK